MLPSDSAENLGNGCGAKRIDLMKNDSNTTKYISSNNVASTVRCRKPLSSDNPTAEELALDDELQRHIMNINTKGDRKFILSESVEGEERRRIALEKFAGLVNEWDREISTAKNIQIDNSENHNHSTVQIRLFGSSRLGVINCKSDIDILVLAPAHITAEDFFTSLSQKLYSHGDVESIYSIPEAYTPVMKVKLDSYSLDIIFTSIKYNIVPHNIDVLDLRCLRGMDDQNVRSLNGARVAEWMCKLIPNMKTYAFTLRVVKHWAKQRGIYSNVLGFLGGVNFAILVTFVCQLYVNACPFTLLQKFFTVMVRWRWPHPILIHTYAGDFQMKDPDGTQFTEWNPKLNHKDALHMMPIITPAYPSMNSAHNVCYPQFRYIQEEVYRAYSICQTFPTNPVAQIDALFQCCKNDFFTRFLYYVQVDVVSCSNEDHLMWFGWVESRIRMLILALEQPPSVCSHPVANCFFRRLPSQRKAEVVCAGVSYISNSSDTMSDTDSLSENLSAFTPPRMKGVSSSQSDATSVQYVSTFFIGLSFQKGLDYVDLTFTINDFRQKVYVWSRRKEGMDVNIIVCSQKNLPSFVWETDSEPSNVASCTPKSKTAVGTKSVKNGNNPATAQNVNLEERFATVADTTDVDSNSNAIKESSNPLPIVSPAAKSPSSDRNLSPIAAGDDIQFRLPS